MGTEPTEFDLMEIIGLDESMAGSKVGEIKSQKFEDYLELSGLLPNIPQDIFSENLSKEESDRLRLELGLPGEDFVGPSREYAGAPTEIVTDAGGGSDGSEDPALGGAVSDESWVTLAPD
jgi:hypothetical protein